MPRAKGSKNVHKLSNINESSRTATCAHCGLVKIKAVPRPNGWKSGWKCKKQSNAWERERQIRMGWKFRGLDYRKNKLSTCERCGFTPEDACQLDVHHRDGNHSNGAKENLQTLCANCHRLVTKLENQGIYRPHS